MGTVKTATPVISPLAGEPIKRADAERLAGVLKAFAGPGPATPAQFDPVGSRGGSVRQ
ncbi:arsR-family transcriptional regulator [Micromonospora sp. ATCC 39149]|nr:arsR-family transcriptional regulator [Micromonospora sp. ATCC 39149]